MSPGAAEDRSRDSSGRDPEQTRRAILRATAETIATQGDAAVRVAQVARDAGVTTGAIYGQFENRQHLIAAAHTEFMSEIVDQTLFLINTLLDSGVVSPMRTPEYSEIIRQTLTSETASSELRWMSAAAQSLHDPILAAHLHPMERQIMDHVTTLIRRGQDDGWMRTDLDPRAMAVILFGAIMGMSVTSRVYSDDPHFVEQMVEAWPLVPEAFEP